MEKREVLKSIIKDIISGHSVRAHYYPNISDKVKAKLTKHFDHNINTNNIVAFMDTSVWETSKAGLVFTLTGIYNLEMMEKPYYFNYKDIVTMKVIPYKDGKMHSTESTLEILLSNGNKTNIGFGYFYKDNLKDLFEKLREQFLKWDDVVCTKISGEVGKLDLTEDQRKKCNVIIHSAAASASAAGAGLAQIPLGDSAVITPIQVAMIIALGKVFGIRVTEGAAKGILGGAAASVVGRGVSQVLVGWIPGIGNAINTATAAAVTETIGWTAVTHFFNLQQEDKAKYKTEGMKEGYNAASEEYEGKLRKQADEFLNQRKNYKEQADEYDELLSEYEVYVAELEKKLSKSEEDLRKLKSIKSQYEALRHLKKMIADTGVSI